MENNIYSFIFLALHFIYEEGNGNQLQYSCLENPMDRGACQAIVRGVTKSRTQLNNFTSLHFTFILSR